MAERIVMESADHRIIKTRKTRARFWKDVKEGDVIRFVKYLDSVGRGRELYAETVTVLNLTQETSVEDSTNQLLRNLNGFELEVVE